MSIIWRGLSLSSGVRRRCDAAAQRGLPSATAAGNEKASVLMLMSRVEAGLDLCG